MRVAEPFVIPFRAGAQTVAAKNFPTTAQVFETVRHLGQVFAGDRPVERIDTPDGEEDEEPEEQ